MVRVKDRIVLYDIDRVCDLYQEVKDLEERFLKRGAKQRLRLLSQRKELQRDIIERLTGIKKVKKKHFRAFVEIIKAANLLGNKATPDAKGTIDAYVNHIAALVSKTPHEIRSGLTMAECEPYRKSIERVNAIENLAMVKAQHMPQEFLKEISQKLAQTAIKRAQIAETEERPKDALSQFRSIVENACLN